MTVTPEISVVMSVYNGAPCLCETMDSVLSQEGINFEFIVVNDGSTDATAEILAEYASRDSRIDVLSQRNLGLTRALIAGCARARGKYIARQDCGDVSLAGRLARQRAILDDEPTVVMVSCATRFMGPCDEELYTIAQCGGELEDRLKQLTMDKVRGPSHHGSTMFRRATYEQVGGYRAAFPVAQDLDLWMRLSEVGVCWATPDVLCEARLSKSAISAVRRVDQLRMTKVIIKCAAARRFGREDATLIARLAKHRKFNKFSSWVPQRLQKARFYYFIGSMLRQREPEQAEMYFRQAVRTWFPYPKAWYRIFEHLRGQ
jgi:glycosyltransferase involved in cell wall biosynthesis